MIFNRDITLIIIPSRLGFVLNISEHLDNWDPFKGPLKRQYCCTFNPLGH